MAATTTPHRPSVLRFGIFELDLEEGVLRRQGRQVDLAPQPFLLLALLVSQPGRILSRESIRQALWSDAVHVDFDQGINSAIRQIRSALGDAAEAPRFVETVPKRGYRFLAQVRATGEALPRSSDLTAGMSTAMASRILMILTSTVVLVALLAVLLYRDVQKGPPLERVMLAVLPFEDLSPEGERESYFSAGLTEELISHLGRRAPEALGVIARTSIVGYQGTTKPVHQIGEELGVDFLLEGSVRRDGDQLRITAQLIRTEDQTHLWAESYDHRWDDLFTVQRRVAERVTEALAATLEVPLAAPLPPPPTGHPEAYDAYLRGRYHFSQYTHEGYARAVEELERAVALDPGFAQAYAALAEAQIFLAWKDPQERAPVEAARRAAGQALTLDSGSAQAHTVLGVAAFYFDWDFTAAGELFEHAVALDPGYAEAHHWYAGYLSALERHSDALYQEVLARRLDPRSLTVRSDRCWYLLFAGRAREARAECRATLELEPHHHWALQGLVEATAGTPFIVPEEVGEAVARYWALHGEPEGAVAALSAMEPEAVVRAYRQWQHRRWEGREEEEPPAPPVALAMARAGVGDLEGAFAALERALETRDPWLVFLDVDPRFDPLQDDRRFFELRRKVGLPSR